MCVWWGKILKAFSCISQNVINIAWEVCIGGYTFYNIVNYSDRLPVRVIFLSLTFHILRVHSLFRYDIRFHYLLSKKVICFTSIFFNIFISVGQSNVAYTYIRVVLRAKINSINNWRSKEVLTTREFVNSQWSLFKICFKKV